VCGIAGVVSYRRVDAADHDARLLAACEHLRPRGPDGEGRWQSRDRTVTLAHRRLAIIDLSERAAQPMASADGARVITFNGEIYNYRELQREVIAAGRELRTTSDTEVLLHLYELFGPRMFEKVRGMFAFGLWDAQQRKLLLARDAYGIKPLYYTDDGGRVAFASQVKSLVAGGFVGRSSVAPVAQVGFYLLGSVPEPWTTHAEVRALPAGSYAWVDARGTAAPIRYFNVASTYRNAVASPSPAESQRQTWATAAVLDSVRHHLVADVPVGVFLSAGIDSGALLGLMSDAGQEQARAITLAFEEFRHRRDDETALAARVAAHYHASHAVRVVPRIEFEQDLPAILAAMDQPSIDGINTWFVSKAARESGLKVALSGLGGDELWGGYPSFVDVPRWVSWMGVPSRVPLFARVWKRATEPIIRHTALSPKLAALAELGGTFAGAYLLRRGLFLPAELPDILDADTIEAGLAQLDVIAHIESCLQPDPDSDFGRVATLESSLYMRNQLLRDTDWASMAHSLEVRTPLVDRELLRALAPLVSAGKQSHAKALLAGSPSKPLPAEVARRPKTGFTTPIAEWLGDCSQVDDWRRVPILMDSRCHWSRRWAYTVLQRFIR
jgi:asparagine synthase (glutamine-hydrolysing)